MKLQLPSELPSTLGDVSEQPGNLFKVKVTSVLRATLRDWCYMVVGAGHVPPLSWLVVLLYRKSVQPGQFLHKSRSR